MVATTTQEPKVLILATLSGGTVSLTGGLASLDGKTIIKNTLTGPAGAAERLGRSLGDDLLSRGAGPILEGLKQDA